MKILVNDADFSSVSIGRASGVVITYNMATDASTLRPNEPEGKTYYWNTATGIGTTVKKTQGIYPNLLLYSLCIGGVRAGDSVYLKTYGGQGCRAWCFANTQNEIVSVSDAGANLTDGVTLTVPQDGYLYVGCNEREFDVNNVVIRITTV